MSYNFDTGKYEGYIYLITNDITGQMYVGETSITVNDRWLSHVARSNLTNVDYITSNVDLAIREYGKENFTVKELEKIICDSEDGLREEKASREIYWISYYNTYYSGKDYNQTPGGELLYLTTQKNVLIYTINGEYVTKIKGNRNVGAFLGVGASAVQAACRDYSEYPLCGNHIVRYEDNPLTSEDLEVIRYKYPQYYMYDFNGKLIKIFDNNLDDAIEYMLSIGKRITKVNINHACDEPGFSSKGFIWRRFPDKFEDKPLPPKVKQRQVEKRNPYTGELICVYPDLNSASKEEKIPHRTLHSCFSRAKGQRVTRGVYWCYVGDGDLELFEKYKSENHMMKKYRCLDNASVL